MVLNIASANITADIPTDGLLPETRARIALMRFGMGPKAVMPQNFWTNYSVVDKCLQDELTPSSPGYFSKKFLNEMQACRLGGSNEYAMPNWKAELNARYRQHMRPVIGLNERLVLYWMNHFSMNFYFSSTGMALSGVTERNAIRRYTFDRFEKMLLSMCQSHMMLTYLDGRKSTKDKTNQNFAREILELHTVGTGLVTLPNGQVRDNYSQGSVNALAKMLTGWSAYHNGNDQKYVVGSPYIPSRNTPGPFIFNFNAHDLNPQTIQIGNDAPKTFTTVSGPAGVEQGIAALKYLAAHELTARYIARRMAKHFISDDPSEDLVTAIANSFKDNDGDLRHTAVAMISHRDSWSPSFNRIRQPYSWLMSILRALNMPLDRLDVIAGNGTDTFGQPYIFDWGDILFKWIRFAGQIPWKWATPEGFPDDNDYWMSGNELRLRANAVYGFLDELVRMRDFPVGWGDVRSAAPGERLLAQNTPRPTAIPAGIQRWMPPMATTLTTSLAPMLSRETRAAVNGMVSSGDAPSSAKNLKALALLFTSPEFLLR